MPATNCSPNRAPPIQYRTEPHTTPAPATNSLALVAGALAGTSSRPAARPPNLETIASGHTQTPLFSNKLIAVFVYKIARAISKIGHDCRFQPAGTQQRSTSIFLQRKFNEDFPAIEGRNQEEERPALDENYYEHSPTKPNGEWKRIPRLIRGPDSILSSPSCLCDTGETSTVSRG